MNHSQYMYMIKQLGRLFQSLCFTTATNYLIYENKYIGFSLNGSLDLKRLSFGIPISLHIGSRSKFHFQYSCSERSIMQIGFGCRFEAFTGVQRHAQDRLKDMSTFSCHDWHVDVIH